MKNNIFILILIVFSQYTNAVLVPYNISGTYYNIIAEYSDPNLTVTSDLVQDTSGFSEAIRENAINLYTLDTRIQADLHSWAQEEAAESSASISSTSVVITGPYQIIFEGVDNGIANIKLGGFDFRAKINAYKYVLGIRNSGSAVAEAENVWMSAKYDIAQGIIYNVDASDLGLSVSVDLDTNIFTDLLFSFIDFLGIESLGSLLDEAAVSLEEGLGDEIDDLASGTFSFWGINNIPEESFYADNYDLGEKLKDYIGSFTTDSYLKFTIEETSLYQWEHYQTTIEFDDYFTLTTWNYYTYFWREADLTCPTCPLP